MIRIFLAVVVAMSLVLGAMVPSTAQAQQTITVSCKNLTADACNTMIAALKRAPYQGPIRPANEPMACARVVSYGPAPVVWVAGDSRTYDKGAPVIADTGVVYTEPFALNERWTVTESCIPRRLLAGVQDLTLCTGLYDDGYHWSLTDDELRSMKRSGHFTSYVPFLEVRDRESLSVSQVMHLYEQRYLR